jgi:hypothetical protein
MKTPDLQHADADVLVARLATGAGVLGDVVLDRDTLADLVLEGVEESQRARGTEAQTSWWDAAEAADLILFHVAQLTADPG